MTRKEFSMALALAQSSTHLETFLGEGSSDRLNELLSGFGLPDYDPVDVTVRDVAALIRHQCLQMNGEMDNENLTEIREIGRRKFNVVGIGDESLELVVGQGLPDWCGCLL